ncbi:MAG: 3'(2'),5'-bisphosphate nucleotidase CysQ [Cytophagales bacterium]|nr:3'(2'),5'-bisphosphate nucleotidase CysQ [Cytophagales bacterium]MDW8384004.1 3'(2'),5'-bisphosphate nucleotidase CysQ [Flammeovirgaceae bacterium]
MQSINLQNIIALALRAGKAIMEVYESGDFQTTLKSDSSPLTRADKQSHRIIVEGLSNLYPQIPIISEEGLQIPFKVRERWKEFWLIDPLDGTKEFVKRNHQFTVNIALIRYKYPVLGVVYAPALQTLYFADEKGAYKQLDGELPFKLVVPHYPNYYSLRSVSSENESQSTEILIKKALEVKTHTKIGSSLKFCLLAENKADYYVRNKPLMEWDAAAGQAILETSGGRVYDAQGNRLSYNTETMMFEKLFAIGYQQNDGIGWKTLQNISLS